MAADIRQCKMCGKLFHSLGNPLCSECSDEMDRRFIKVRDFIYTHPEANIPEIVEKTEVPEKNILAFLREERLVLAHASGLLNCERCLAPITSGRFCDDCKNQLIKALKPSVVHKAAEQSEPEPEKQPQKKESKKNDGQGMVYSRYRRS